MNRALALSVNQPWAYLLAIGQKCYETRSWKTEYRGPVLIHASKRWNMTMARACYEAPFFAIMWESGIKFPASLFNYRSHQNRVPDLGLAFGAVIGFAILEKVIATEDLLEGLSPQERAFGNFKPGRYAFLYERPVRLATPIPCRGKLGLFEVDAEIHEAVSCQSGLVAAERM